MAQNNGGKWDKNFIVAVIGLIAAILALVVAVTTPELRKYLGLEKNKSEASLSATDVPPKTKPPSGPFSATLHENQPQFIAEAKTRLAIIFNEEFKIVTLTIAPDGKQSSSRAVLNGYTEEFTSSTGVFLVHVMNVDWGSRTVTVQVSRKS